MRYVLLTFLCVLSLNAAHAQEQTTFMDTLPPEGVTILTLSASERMTLEQDELIATLRIEVKADSARDVQARINENMDRAIKRAKKDKEIKVETGRYSVYERWNRPQSGEERRVIGWQGQQMLTLRSKDKDALLEAVTDIQELGFATNNLSYQLSREKREDIQDELMAMALKKLQARARAAADALGKSQIQFIEISEGLASNFPRPVPMMRSMAAMESADAMPKAVAEAGETDVTTSVNARILLKP